MLIISASNVKKTKKNSQSLLLATTLQKSLRDNDIDSDILDLRDYELTPCIMCEKCVKSGKCVRGDDYNKVYKKILKHKDIAVICPHYAGIPAKLMMLLEKIQEVCYLKSCTKQKDAYPLKGSVAAIIAHGGMTEGYEGLYNSNIVVPLGNALKALGMVVVNDTITIPLTVGVKQYFEKRESKSVCYLKENDNEVIRKVISELVNALKKDRS